MKGWLKGLSKRAATAIILSGYSKDMIVTLCKNNKLRTLHGVGESIEREIIEWVNK